MFQKLSAMLSKRIRKILLKKLNRVKNFQNSTKYKFDIHSKKSKFCWKILLKMESKKVHITAKKGSIRSPHHKPTLRSRSSKN